MIKISHGPFVFRELNAIKTSYNKYMKEMNFKNYQTGSNKFRSEILFYKFYKKSTSDDFNTRTLTTTHHQQDHRIYLTFATLHHCHHRVTKIPFQNQLSFSISISWKCATLHNDQKGYKIPNKNFQVTYFYFETIFSHTSGWGPLISVQ